jgi:hypothetical protein
MSAELSGLGRTYHPLANDCVPIETSIAPPLTGRVQG